MPLSRTLSSITHARRCISQQQLSIRAFLPLDDLLMYNSWGLNHMTPIDEVLDNKGGKKRLELLMGKLDQFLYKSLWQCKLAFKSFCIFKIPSISLVSRVKHHSPIFQNLTSWHSPLLHQLFPGYFSPLPKSAHIVPQLHFQKKLLSKSSEEWNGNFYFMVQFTSCFGI